MQYGEPDFDENNKEAKALMLLSLISRFSTAYSNYLSKSPGFCGCVNRKYFRGKLRQERLFGAFRWSKNQLHHQ